MVAALAAGLRPPVLSLPDPVSADEGGIDPLSLQAVYEQLAERILPFVTVRMARPRFLTAIAVGAVVCERLLDEVAKDGVTPAWLVYEWYVIEAFVRARGATGADAGGRIPGIQKVDAALRNRRPVSAASYLKTAQIFGFTGVYRRLATGLRVVDDELRLDDGGYELVRIWEQERGLEGFLSASSGPGAGLRSSMREAVGDGLAKGHTARTTGWVTWRALAESLAPAAAGPRERRWLYERLLRTDLQQNPRDPEATMMRREFIERLRQHGRWVEPGDEHEYFGQLKGSPGLRRRIALVRSYEALCGALIDAFNLVLSLGGRTGGPEVQSKEFHDHPLAGRLARRLPAICEELGQRFREEDPDVGVGPLIERYQGIRTPESLLLAVLDHHEDAQTNKPPDGKRPWVERGARGGRLFVRADYRRESPPVDNDSFVHHYRTRTCCSFLRDLGRLGR